MNCHIEIFIDGRWITAAVFEPDPRTLDQGVGGGGHLQYDIDYAVEYLGNRAAEIIADMREELETFGLTAGEKALRELERLNAGEEELAEARRLSAEQAQKQAEVEAEQQRQREEEQAQKEAQDAVEKIGEILRGLQEDVADLALSPAQRAVAQQLRELRKLGAS